MLNEMINVIRRRLLYNRGLCREFRTSMAKLCSARVNPANTSSDELEALWLWLRGGKCSLTTLKHLQIYRHVGRHNARLLLNSLATWSHLTGHSGLVILLNMDAVVSRAATERSLVRYTRRSAVDTYELLRQFIEATDEVSHLLLVACAGPELLDERTGRSLHVYAALKMRTADDVYDAKVSNPLNAMVTLSLS